jgi:hypothetical protein
MECSVFSLPVHSGEVGAQWSFGVTASCQGCPPQAALVDVHSTLTLVGVIMGLVVRWAAFVVFSSSPSGLAAPSAEIRLVQFKAPDGVVRKDLETFLRTQLPSLASCQVFTSEEGVTLVRVPDQKVKGGPLQIAFGVTDTTWADAAGDVADVPCLRRVVSAWPLPERLQKNLRRAKRERDAAVLLQLDFKPNAAARASLRKDNAAGLAALCTAFEGASPQEDPRPRLRDVAGRLPPAVAGRLEIVLRDAPATALERSTWLAENTRAASMELTTGTACPAFRGWLPLSDEELMHSPNPPSGPCAQRVSQFKTLASAPPLEDAVFLRSALTRPRDVPGEELSEDDFKTSALGQLQGAPLRARAIEAQRKQGRPRPVLYVRVPVNSEATELTKVGLAWGAHFEVRLLVTRAQFEAGPRAKTAWPSVVAALLEQQRSETLSVLGGDAVRAAVDDELQCPGLGRAAAQARAAPELEMARTLASSLAAALPACGCPPLLAETLWARVAILEDAAQDSRGLTWRPLEIAAAEPAKVLVLDTEASAEDLLKALPDEGPVVVRFQQLGPRAP